MATVNLASKYSTKLDQRFTQGSVTDAWCGDQYDWDGVNAIKVWTLGQAQINDYNASGANRYGSYHEVDDELNVYQLIKKRSFCETFDETNVQDQMFIKKGAAYLKQVWDEQFVPEIDQYRLTTWANGAGLGTLNKTELTNSTMVTAILDAHAKLSNRRVPRKNRVTFVPESYVINCQLSEELKGSPAFLEKAIVNGQVTTLGGFPVVSAPDDLFPAGIEFLVKYKQASADPVKLKSLKAKDDADDVEGILMTGLVRYDSFVLANKADGIFVYAKSGMLTAPTVSIASGSATITGTSGATIKYTTDGSNPKTSTTAEVYSAAVTVEAGTTVRAYQYKAGNVNSPIASATA
jgi:hypothetical protein